MAAARSMPKCGVPMPVASPSPCLVHLKPWYSRGPVPRADGIGALDDVEEGIHILVQKRVQNPIAGILSCKRASFGGLIRAAKIGASGLKSCSNMFAGQLP